MTTTSTHHIHGPSSSSFEHYDPDDVLPKNSPLLKAHLRLEPTPSPPPGIPMQKVSLSPSPSRRGSNRRSKVQPSQGDAILVSMLDEGRNPDIAREAGARPLPPDTSSTPGTPGRSPSDSSDSQSERGEHFGSRRRDYDRPGPRAPAAEPETRKKPAMRESPPPPPPPPAPGPPAIAADLMQVATNALLFRSARSETDDAKTRSSPVDARPPGDGVLLGIRPVDDERHPDGSARGSDDRSSLTPAAHIYSPPRHVGSPPGQFDRSPPGQMLRNGHGDLAPLHMPSPGSDANGFHSLPSIRSTLGDLKSLANPADKELPLRHSHTYPPHGAGTPLTRLTPLTSHGSPPVSPNDHYRHDLASPRLARPATAAGPYYHYANGASHTAHISEYSGSSTTETPGTDVSGGSGSTPATTASHDRMSIDGITNRETATGPVFRCTFEGCTAPPFQTQYLLNSHANVHSQARPHYCPVKGCSRGEGGKGFKRKNEMIRHGLVHDSPGYVCPFCPDREHKYPRPDNLQRHVRVHHVDKDKDDPLLRDVLAQRPDGPNRGRRRRGAPS